ncbi:MAG: MFS transporter [Candidatus Velthaea sp.]
MSPGSTAPRLGLGPNAGQFWLLVAVNAFVGAMVGLERDVLPLVGERLFSIASQTAVVSFIVSFGLAKALTNLVAGRTADRIGRKPLLVAGWVVGLPVPFILMFAPTWSWIVFANVLLGINQGLCWSMTVVMKIDLVGPLRRGFAMGLNEFAGYLAVAIAAFVSGAIAQAYGLRPWPFALGVVVAVVGLLLSIAFVRETRGFAIAEAAARAGVASREGFGALFARVSWRDRTLGAVSQAGLVNNLNDGLVWGIVPLYLATSGLGIERIAVIAAIYPATWGILQIVTGSLSDRIGRKAPIVAGMVLQGVAIALFAVRGGFALWLLAAVALGAGTALVYPTLLAAIADVTAPAARASAIGIYRLWRDAGYAIGALLSGIIADVLGQGAAIVTVAALTCASGLFVAVRMRETHIATPAPSLKGITL